MTDEQLLSLIQFVLFRFVGAMPDDRMLKNAISDWKHQS